MKKKSVILAISLCALPLILNNYVIAQPTQKQLESFRSAKTVRIEVNQSYGEARGVRLPFEDVARRFFEYAGLRVAESDAEDYELKIKIEAKGRALGASYERIGWRYSGASLSGLISLEIQGMPAYQKAFEGIMRPSSIEFSTMGKTRSEAPFMNTFYKPGSFVSKAVEMIGEIYGIDWYTVALKDSSESVSKLVAEALINIKDTRVVDFLIIALKDTSTGDRSSIAKKLGNIKDSRAVEPLINVLNDEDINVRIQAMEALGNIGDTRAVEPLIAAMKGDKYSSGKALLALGNIKDPLAFSALIAALKGPNSGSAAMALGNLKDTRAVEPLIDILQKEKKVPPSVIRALGNIADPRAVEPLITAIHARLATSSTSIYGFMTSAAEALGKIGDPRAVEILIILVGKYGGNTKTSAAVALKSIAGEDFGEDPERWKKWWTENKEKFLKKKKNPMPLRSRDNY